MKNRNTHDIIKEQKTKPETVNCIIDNCMSYPVVTIENIEETLTYSVMFTSPYSEKNNECPEVAMFGSYKNDFRTQVASVQNRQELQKFLNKCMDFIPFDTLVISMDLS